MSGMPALPRQKITFGEKRAAGFAACPDRQLLGFALFDPA
jgi:hypothetical protein